MPKEIKFRAWDKRQKIEKTTIGQLEMFEVWLIDWVQQFVMAENQERIALKDIELMQFTGLKDKNGKGKEVYEGDLIRRLPSGYEPRAIHEVVWDEERLEWGIKLLGLITSLWTFNKDFEVIGNIYENPELLPKD